MAHNAMAQTTYLSVRQVAHLLGLTPRTIYRMCQRGYLDYILTGATGTTYRIPQASVDAHLTPAQPPAPVPHIDGQMAIVG